MSYVTTTSLVLTPRAVEVTVTADKDRHAHDVIAWTPEVRVGTGVTRRKRLLSKVPLSVQVDDDRGDSPVRHRDIVSCTVQLITTIYTCVEEVTHQSFVYVLAVAAP